MTDYDSGFFDGFHGGYYSGLDQGKVDRLEQVIEWLKSNLGDKYISNGHPSLAPWVDVEIVIDDLKKAMRPTTQENN